MGKKLAHRVLKDAKTKKGKKGSSSKPIEPQKPLIPAPINWTKSTVSEATLMRYVNTGELPRREEISWRAAGNETRPTPQDDEVVVLLDHVTRGMRPPGSNFFRRVLAYYELTPLDLSPNSVLNICTYAVYCEVFLQVKPNLSLFLETFYCNPQNKKGHAMGPYGGVAIQRRRSASLHFPSLTLASHPKGWHNTYFYCKDTTPQRQKAKYPKFRLAPLEWNSVMNSQDVEASARLEVAALMQRGQALITHGLTGIDLMKCWLGWSIQPLAIRPRIMYEYTGEPTDNLRFTEVTLSEDQIVKAAKPLLGEKTDALHQYGLLPFYTKNPAPPLVILTSYFNICYIFVATLLYS